MARIFNEIPVIDGDTFLLAHECVGDSVTVSFDGLQLGDADYIMEGNRLVLLDMERVLSYAHDTRAYGMPRMLVSYESLPAIAPHE